MAHGGARTHGSRRRGASTAGRRGSEAHTSREAILGAATELMAERGFAATSIGSICTATGLAPTAIYWHFGSKDGLLAAIVERSIERWYAELVEAMGGELAEASEEAVPPVADLQRFFRVMLNAYRHQPQALRLMLWLGLDAGIPTRRSAPRCSRPADVPST